MAIVPPGLPVENIYHQYPLDMPRFVISYNSRAEKLRIWQANRAISTAPFFFKSLICGIEDEQRSHNHQYPLNMPHCITPPIETTSMQ
jgi:hypothetical protein